MQQDEHRNNIKVILMLKSFVLITAISNWDTRWRYETREWVRS